MIFLRICDHASRAIHRLILRARVLIRFYIASNQQFEKKLPASKELELFAIEARLMYTIFHCSVNVRL